MTGEVTLRGPGAADRRPSRRSCSPRLRGGLKKVLIPQDNAKDLAELPDNVKNALEIVPVSGMNEVLTACPGVRQPRRRSRGKRW